MGSPLGTVTSRLYRARYSLRRRLTQSAAQPPQLDKVKARSPGSRRLSLIHGQR